MSIPPLNTVNVTSRVTLLYGNPGGATAPIQVINTDGANPVSVGTVSNISVGAPNTITIGPGASVGFDGSVSVYAVTSGPTVAIAVTPGGTNYSPGSLFITGPVTATISGPVTVTGTVNIGTVSGSININSVAGNVNVVGQGGYITPGQIATLLNDTTTRTVAPAGQFQYLNLVNVQNYTSLDISVVADSVSQSTAGGALVAPLLLVWFDDAAGARIVSVETYYIYAANGAFSSPPFINAPVRGQYLSLYAGNIGTTGNVSFTNAYISATYRHLNNPVCRQSSSLIANSGSTSAALSQPLIPSAFISAAYTGELGQLNGVTPGTGLKIYPIPLYSGPLQMQYSVGTAAPTSNLTIMDLSYVNSGGIVAGGSGAGVIWNSGTITIGSVVPVSLLLPRAPCALIVNAAATTVINMSFVGQQGY